MKLIKNHTEWFLFLICLLVGVITVQYYGIAWDEHLQRTIGETCYDYIVNGNQFYLQDANKDHGVLIELPLFAIEKIFNIKDFGNIYLIRHVICHILFLFGCVYLYKLINSLYNNKTLAICGFLILLLHPTIYTHSFFNSKDVPFLTLTILFFYQFHLAFRDKKTYQFILLGLSLALLISLRIMGVMHVAFTLFFLTIQIAFNIKDKIFFKKQTIYIIILLSSTVLFTISLWPALWKHPISNFIEIFGSFSKFRWDSTVLYLGENVNGQNLPWHYSIIWFLINNPICYLLIGFIGIIMFITKFKIFNLNQDETRNNLLYFFSFISPVLSIIILKSVIFDGWRHIFFIYPAFILMAIYALNILLQSKFKKISVIALASSFSFVIFFITSNFPNQHVYFNEIVPKKDEYIRHNFEMDYWGVTYKQALEYILQNDQSSKIKVAATDYAYLYNFYMLSPEESNRIEIVKDTITNADYFITNYRWHHQDYTELNAKEVHSIEVCGSKINTVLKIQH